MVGLGLGELGFTGGVNQKAEQFSICTPPPGRELHQ